MATKVSAFNTSPTNQRAAPVVGLAFRSAADGELYVVEGDETGGIPVSIVSGAGAVTDVNLTKVAGTNVLTDYGAGTTNAQRTVANISVAGAAVAAGNPVPVTPGAGVVFAVSGPLTDAQLRASPLPLPSGAATGALQTTGNTSLSSIDGKTATLVSGRVPVDVASLPLPSGGSTSALQTTGNTSLASIDGKAPALVGGRVPVDHSGTIFAGNSSTTTLAANGVFTGTAQDTLGFGVITIQAFADVTSAIDGLLVEWSLDGTNWDDSDPFTVAAGNGRFFTFGPQARFFRLRYTNGATLQTAFRLQTIGKIGYVKPSSHRLSEVITDDSDAELQKAVVSGRTSTGTYVNIATSATGALSTSGNEFAASNYGTPAATTTQRVAAMLGVGSTAVSTTNPVPTVESGSVGVQLRLSTEFSYFQDFASISLVAGYTQVIASTGTAITKLLVTNNSSIAIHIATGAAASEVSRYLVMPGEAGVTVPLQIASGTRIAIRTISGTLTSGQFAMSAF